MESGFESFGVQIDTSDLNIVDVHSSYGDVCDFTLEKLNEIGEDANIIFDTFSHYLNNHQDRC
ncbi:MAG: hypothetical protein SV377_07255, partial [Halobacteria archaeon]|nr:hypothetical protein [Halobacteria archaeon]